MSDPIQPWQPDLTKLAFDNDLESFDAERLRCEVIALRNAIRLHRDERGHDRCWLDDGRLYGALPEMRAGDTALPPLPEFLHNCERFWRNRQATSESK